MLSIQTSGILGRVLLPAFTFADIYHLKNINDRGDGPYYPIDALGSMPEETTPERTRHESFPKWTKNWGEFGNRMTPRCGTIDRPCTMFGALMRERI